jgi:hypothetical protein
VHRLVEPGERRDGERERDTEDARNRDEREMRLGEAGGA